MSSLQDRFFRAFADADQLISLRDEALALINRLDRDEEIGMDNVDEMIDIVQYEAFALRIKRRFDTHYNEEVVIPLLQAVLQLKESQYRHYSIPEISHNEDGCASLCRYCDWALSRIDRGPENGGPELDEESTSNEYAHLCALDSSPEFPVLTERSRAGCDLCRFILTCLAADSGEGLDFPSDTSGIWLQFGWISDAQVNETVGTIIHSVVLIIAHLNHDASFIRFRLETTDDMLQKDLCLLRPLAPTPLDPANIKLINSCLQVSDYSTTCRFIPKRLIDLGSTQESNPRVVEMSDYSPSTQPEGSVPILYGALSYCWGPPEHAKRQVILTSETRHKLSQGVSMNELTKVVQDAITACRTFSLRYLWVDALCIMQQDKTDWEEQSYQMNLVYGNSAITFCTPATWTCLEHFLVRKIPRQIKVYLRCKVTQKEGAVSLIQSRDRVQDIAIFGSSPLEQDLEVSQWNNRGWVFQEKVLSPRKIYFGAEMIHVQVNGTVTSENGYILKENEIPEYIHLPKEYMTVNPETIVQRSPKEPVLWYEVIEKFSVGKWTNPLDVFPGLSGIARMFREIFEIDYVAGLWVEDLKCGLIFESGDTGAENFSTLLHFLSSEAGKIGPSWSWACRPEFSVFVISFSTMMRCRVRSHLRAEFQILRVQNNIDGTNPLGRIHSASLTLSGKVIRVPEMWKSSEAGTFYTFQSGHELYLEPDWMEQKSITDEDRKKISLLLISSCCCTPAEQISKQLRKPEDDDDFAPLHEDIIDWPEYTWSFDDDQDPDFNPATDCELCAEGQERDAWGLMIYPAGLPNKYYRVGWFLARAYFGGLRIFDKGEEKVIELV